MEEEQKFQSRITFTGDLIGPLAAICEGFGLGEYKNHNAILVGYEDYNVALQTEKGKFFVKFFASFRSDADCERYVEIISKTIEAGVSEPKLCEFKQGFIFRIPVGQESLRVIVMEHIEGQTFYELQRPLTESEAREVIRQASLINTVKYQPTFLYDSWSIPNFLQEFALVEKLIPEADLALLKPLVEEFTSVDLKKLPHALVHGDIIKTNVILSSTGKVYIIDFAVANYYPRIQEIAIILCNMLFDEDHPQQFRKFYDLALEEYQKKILLTPDELSLLPLFITIQHAMHVVGAVREEKIKHNEPSVEDTYWLEQGRKGLEYMRSFRT